MMSDKPWIIRKSDFFYALRLLSKIVGKKPQQSLLTDSSIKLEDKGADVLFESDMLLERFFNRKVEVGKEGKVFTLFALCHDWVVGKNKVKKAPENRIS